MENKFKLKIINEYGLFRIRWDILKSILIVLSIFTILIEEQIDIDLPNERGWWHENHFFWNTILYFVVSSIIFSLIKTGK